MNIMYLLVLSKFKKKRIFFFRRDEIERRIYLFTLNVFTEANKKMNKKLFY